MILRGNIFSKELEMDTGLTVFIPGPPPKDGKYKSVYLLHGICGCNTNFIDYTMLTVYGQKYDALYIMPDGARSYYTDMRFGQRYFSYIKNELPMLISRYFNASDNPRDRAVIGASMGGYGALKAALTPPYSFGFAGAMAAGCVFLKDFLADFRNKSDMSVFEKEYGKQFCRDFEAIFGADFTWDESHELLCLIQKAVTAPDKPDIFSVCGDRDFLRTFNSSFAEKVGTAGYALEYKEIPGVHDWTFFNEALEICLRKWDQKVKHSYLL